MLQHQHEHFFGLQRLYPDDLHSLTLLVPPVPQHSVPILRYPQLLLLHLHLRNQSAALHMEKGTDALRFLALEGVKLITHTNDPVQEYDLIRLELTPLGSSG